MSTLISATVAWDSDQLEIFDLVEEINQNFYTVFNISQDAELPAIQKAFRSLSLLLHPDKNDSPDAEVQSRNIVAVYDVLKDPSKHEHYNEVLKMACQTGNRPCITTDMYGKWDFIVLTIGQYFVSWAAYIEKKYTAKEIAGGPVSSKSTECWPSTLKGRQTRRKKLPSVYLTQRK
ncbi:uncharacterized protein CBL_08445 [Carabus blaptoides fortunei]